ncbi:nicotinate-nucleotide adenylyltransferase [Herbaspirillum robiniae]|uniref:Probable nicotinate-nucleotide adenylyltransferase n=1 Tax=Herbaspirillum robiniae TaxID=2014887 RepID=A0A246WR98_9BURK|nr:nicotinate-nucleotide adenylyltransferase [Herbaspirillum robiniae]NUU01943.1 nicotinate-nucleotide adenylyltransferase [Herbaspirillum robiniae]OWY28929.1 nicotinate-nucleotide adenylyltransferase [Herbaspirillum robiniae]
MAPQAQTASRCIAVLGGSFDPVHNGHVLLAEHFVQLLRPDELRVIPAGNPWQKHGLQASPADRVEMVRRAFDARQVPVVIDEQEIRRTSATYTIDTLRALRAELGPAVSIVFLMGADQLLHLDTWQHWQELFDYAHLCAASRPGFTLAEAHVPPAVMEEFKRRSGSPQDIRSTTHGYGYLASGLAVDISSTEIRAQLQRGARPDSLIPGGVLDYIEQQHLYRN